MGGRREPHSPGELARNLASMDAAGSEQAKDFDWSRCRLGEGRFSEGRYVFAG